MENLHTNLAASERTIDTDPQHPFSEGDRVRHYGRRWSQEAFATVIGTASLYRGDFEYTVMVDEGSSWPSAGTTTEWNSHNTYLGSN